MMAKVFSVICIVSIIFGIAVGNIEELSRSVIEGAAGAVELTLSLCGMMGLWNGIMQVLLKAGAVGRLSRALSPFFRLFFPETYRNGEGSEEICSNISANMLGIGNAATPLALSALEKMQSHNPDKDTATDDMITLTVLNTAPLNLIPTTLIALRHSAGAEAPFAIVIPVIISSAATSLFSLIMTRLCSVAFRKAESEHSSSLRAYGGRL